MADAIQVEEWEALLAATPRAPVVTLSLPLMKVAGIYDRLIYNRITLNAFQFIEIVKHSEMPGLYL